MEQINEITKQIVRPHRMDEKGNEKAILWSDIKEFCNSLTKDQLTKSAYCWGDNFGANVFSIAITEDDLINPSGDGVEAREFYNTPEDKEIYDDEPIVIKKGSIILELDN